ncbi:MAG: DUF167 domain-containing protein [Anaerolineaceae bacterium]
MTAKKATTDHSRQAFAHLTIKVQPRSSEDEISEVLDDGTVKIKLTAPPVEGKANEALVHFLSEFLYVKKTAIKIKSGQSARLKIVRIEGLSQESVEKKIIEKKS